MENLFVALSNFPAYFPIKTADRNGDCLTVYAILFVALMSFLSHLVENHKHGMPGIGFSTATSYYLNRLDVLGCVIVVLRLTYIYYKKHGFYIVRDPWLFIGLGVSFLLLRLSEYDKYNADLKTLYLCTHIMWHMCIFTLMDYFLIYHIY